MLLNMESGYHIVTIRVIWTSWAHELKFKEPNTTYVITVQTWVNHRIINDRPSCTIGCTQKEINSCPSWLYGCNEQVGSTWLLSDHRFFMQCLNNRKRSGALFVLMITLDPKTCLFLCFFMQTYKKYLAVQ
jgi:hypothetical protein